MQRYSTDQRTEMVRVYLKERSLVRTAAVLGCSSPTIRTALREHGIEVQPRGGVRNALWRRYPTKVRTEMARVYEREQSLERTALVFGCSHNTIRAVLREFGIQPRATGGRVNPPGTPPAWGRRLSTNGYVTWFGWVSVREANGNRYHVIHEHRLVMERALGRALFRHEEIHHRNGDRTDNRLRNLELRVGRHGTGMTHCPHCGGQLTPVSC